jgi:hypothetical protein
MIFTSPLAPVKGAGFNASFLTGLPPPQELKATVNASAITGKNNFLILNSLFVNIYSSDI